MSAPGKLNRRLVLEQPLETPDGAGGVVRTHEPAATLWASVEPLSAREAFDAARLGIEVTHRITVRAGNDISVRHRLRDGARIFRISSVREQSARGLFLEIVAQERPN